MMLKNFLFVHLGGEGVKNLKVNSRIYIVELPETNSSPLKIGLPKRKVVFQPLFFRGELLVSGRVGDVDPFKTPRFLGNLWSNSQTPKLMLDQNCGSQTDPEIGCMLLWKPFTWQFFVTFLGWLSDPAKGLVTCN